MKISDRLADYVVIGGFFCIVQCAVLVGVKIALVGWTVQLGNMQALASAIPDKAIGPLVALFGAFGLVAVLSTGVFIDLLGSYYFRPSELLTFRAHSRKNAQWMQTFMSRYESYIQDDWSAVLTAPTYRDGLISGFKIFAFWNPKFWAEYVDSLKRTFAGSRSYVRVHTFLLSWISLVGGADRIELLNTQLSFWSVSRAFATVLVLANVEGPFLYWGANLILDFRALETGRHMSTISPSFLLVIYAFQILLSLIAIGLCRGSYSRLCGTIFALCYIADKKPATIPDAQGH